jgi:hypothetical protein
MKSYDITIWAIETIEGKRKKTYRVRWLVAGRKFGKYFDGSTLADNYRTQLKTAQNKGEPFNTEKPGLPDSMMEPAVAEPEPPEVVVTWFELAAKYVDKKWKRLAAKSRETTVYALAALLPGLIDDASGQPPIQALRHSLCRWYLPPASRGADVEIPADARASIEWLRAASIPVDDATSAAVLSAALDGMMAKLDGKEYAPDVVKRRRRILTNFVKFAIQEGCLSADPFAALDWEPPKTVVRLDPRRVPNPCQVAELLTGVSYVGSFKRARGRRLVAFFGCIYYALMRPEEVNVLNIMDCTLPDEGWGRLVVHRARPAAGKLWTDSGEMHDDRGLKQKAEGEVKVVPIPPVLVKMLKDHIADFGVAEDGRIFSNERGGLVAASTYARVYREARELVFPPYLHATSLAADPYDLRHAGISLGLAATRDAVRLAERSGTSAEVLMDRYAWVLDDKDAAANEAIEKQLAA